MAGTPVVLTESAFRELRRAYWEQKRQLANLHSRLTALGTRRKQELRYPPPRVRFKNTASETAPAWGVMRITTPANSEYVTCAKPNATFQGLYLVNGNRNVAAGGFGWGHFLTAESFVWKRNFALYNTAATPTPGQSWGVVNNSWLLHQHGPGFYILGGTTGSGSTARVAVLQVPPAEILVKNDSGGDFAATSGPHTFEVWGGVAGSEADSGLTVSAYNKCSIAFKNGKFGAVGFLNGQAYAVPFQT